MEQHQPSWIKLLFLFDSYGSRSYETGYRSSFRLVRRAAINEFPNIYSTLLFIRQLPSTLRKILIGTYLFIIGGIMSLLFGNPFELASWTLYFVGAFLVHFVGSFCQRFRLRWFIDKIIR